MNHPLSLFAYCPRCGAAGFAPHDARSKRCGACGFVFYANASAATVAVVFDRRGRLLVTRRAFEPAKGTLDLPGGFVDPGEGIDEGLRREVREETGGEVAAARYLFPCPTCMPTAALRCTPPTLSFYAAWRTTAPCVRPTMPSNSSGCRARRCVPNASAWRRCAAAWSVCCRILKQLLVFYKTAAALCSGKCQ